ncbi:hypothetical protein ACEPAH_7700 [Sanghuangporus vaninii]
MSVMIPRMRDASTTDSTMTTSAGFAEMQRKLDADGIDSGSGCDTIAAMDVSHSRTGCASYESTDSRESASHKVGDAKLPAISMPTPSPSPNTPLQPLPSSTSISLPSPDSLSASLRLSLPSPRGAVPDPVSGVNNLEVSSKRQRQQQKRKHISLNHPSHPRTNPAHIPRPRNAFILFRSWALSSGLLFSSSSSSSARSNPNSVKTKGTGPESKKDSTKCITTSQASMPLQQNEASREIAKIWKRVDESTRGVFEEMAREEKRRHREMYPDYRYAPRKVQQQQLQSQEYQSPSRAERKKDVQNGVGKLVKNTGTRRLAATKKRVKTKRRRARAPLTPETTPEPSSPSPSPTSPPETDSESDDVEDTRAGREMHLDADVDMDVDNDIGDDDEDDGNEDSEKEEEEEELPLGKSIDVRTVFKSKSAKSPHPEFTYPSSSSPFPSLSVSDPSPNFSGTSSSSCTSNRTEYNKHALDGTEIETKMKTTFEKTIRTRTTINQAYVPLLASTTYYVPTFVHVDRTCRVPNGPSNPSDCNLDAGSSSAQASSTTSNAVEGTLVNVPAGFASEHDAGNHNSDFNDLEEFSFSFSLDSDKSDSVSGSFYEDEFGFVRFRRSEEEEEQELIQRALKPYAPLWHPSPVKKLSSSSSLTGTGLSSNTVEKREGLAGPSIAQMCMMDLDML